MSIPSHSGMFKVDKNVWITASPDWVSFPFTIQSNYNTGCPTEPNPFDEGQYGGLLINMLDAILDCRNKTWSIISDCKQHSQFVNHNAGGWQWQIHLESASITTWSLTISLVPSVQTREWQKFDWLLARQTPALEQGNRCVVNLSSKHLENSHISVLSKGLNFASAPRQIPVGHFITIVEAAISRSEANEKLAAKKGPDEC